MSDIKSIREKYAVAAVRKKYLKRDIDKVREKYRKP